MDQNMGRPRYSLPVAAERLLEALLKSDQTTDGKPRLRAEDEPYAREWLMEVLLDTLGRFGHVAYLARWYGAEFCQPRIRRDWPDWGVRPAGPAPDRLFRHHELLSDAEAEAIAERGIGADVLPVGRLAVLLLNPYALWDVADLIDFSLPEWWYEPMRLRGERLMAEEAGYATANPIGAVLEQAQHLPPSPTPGLTVSKEEVHGPSAADLLSSWRSAARLQGRGTNCWELQFADDQAKELAGRIAEAMYGDAERAFELLLYRIDRGQKVEFELEVSPAPVKADLQFTITFPGGQQREFTLEVPPELRHNPTAKPRSEMRSDPCEPLDAADGDIAGEGRKLEWQDEMPPHLVVRGEVWKAEQVGVEPGPALKDRSNSPRPVNGPETVAAQGVSAPFTGLGFVARPFRAGPHGLTTLHNRTTLAVEVRHVA